MRTSNIVQKNQSSREVGANAIAMSIDEASSVFLMDALGKLYSRPAQAALREYLSNAIDAHKAKGGNLPAIQITLPDSAATSSGKSHLLIRDFGKGMTEEEFSTILSRYGASTKRDTNTMIGGFGLGAKSGFAVSDEFFMTSYQNGKGIRVRVFKDSMNKGFIDVADRFTTAEADGILVEVPVPSTNVPELTKKSLFTEFPFFMGYGVGTLDVLPKMDLASQSVHNSKVFSPLEMGGSTVGWLGTSTSPASKMYGLIGKVAYSIDLRKISASSKENKVSKDVQEAVTLLSAFKRTKVIDIPIGSVDLPSSREDITYSERSIRTISAILCNYALMLRQSVQKELNTKKTRPQVLKFLADLEESGYKDIASLSWKGVTFGREFFSKSDATCILYTRGHGNVNKILLDRMYSFKSFAAMSAKADYKLGLFNITVDKKGMTAATGLFTYARISKLLKCDDVRFNPTADKALFMFIPKGDYLAEWLTGGEAMELAGIEQLALQEQWEKEAAKAKEAADRVKAQKARERQQKAKETRAQSMLSNFVVNDGNAQSLTCNTVATVFKDTSKRFFYWSEAEVHEFASKTKTANIDGSAVPLFPFIPTKVANNFRVVTTGEYYRKVNYLVKLRSFLRFFFPDGVKVIVLDKSRDLDEFKAEHPEVKSGVLFVKGEIEKQFEKANSEILIAYNAMSDYSYKNSSEVHNLNQFMRRAETAGRYSEVAEDLQAASARFNSVLTASNVRSDNKLDAKTFLSFLKGFATDSEIEKNSYSLDADLQVLNKKYPLVMLGSFTKVTGKHESVVLDHLIDYIRMCDKQQP